MPSPPYSTGLELSQRTLAVVLAGGSGARLGDLTRWHSKPSLPFGGQYRNVDFPLSNCLNSGIRRIALATQYKAHSLIQHLHLGWSFLRPEVGEFIELWPAQQRCGESWYAGTADALHQNLDLIEAHGPAYVLILAGDHIYKMDYRPMLHEHAAKGADVTVGCVEVPLQAASSFGVMQTDARGWITQFDEKPLLPCPAPRNPRVAVASMGIYVFTARFLAECLREDAADPASRHDFGHDILPALLGRARVRAHTFRDPRHDEPAYWRDVGTIDTYWRANLELLADDPPLDLYAADWPIWTHVTQSPPPIFLGDGVARHSIVSGGCRIAGTVEHSVLSQNCRIGADSVVESSVVLPEVTIGADCRIRRAIVDRACHVPDGFDLDRASLGEDLGFPSKEGIALITHASLERATQRRLDSKVAYLRRT